jgi:hypothetical protein
MKEDCHALFSKAGNDGRKVPPEVRHIIAAFVNTPPDFGSLPTGINDYLREHLRYIWPAVRRYELSKYRDYENERMFHRIAIFMWSNEASLRLLQSVNQSVTYSEVWRGYMEQGCGLPSYEPDHSTIPRRQPMAQSIIDKILSGRYGNLRIMWSYAWTDHPSTPKSEEDLLRDEEERLYAEALVGTGSGRISADEQRRREEEDEHILDMWDWDADLRAEEAATLAEFMETEAAFRDL